jgi:hypothetical protein
MERTHRKLGEARFFYRHLVNERQQDVTTEPEAFGYYFSACIQAERNVLWTLHNEEPEKWEAWEPKWKKTLTEEQREFLKFTNELRLDETKRGGTEMILEWENVAFDELLPKANAHHPAYQSQYHRRFSSTFGVPMTAFRSRRVFYLQNREEVTKLCERYLDFLDKAVQEFMAAHT